MSASAPGFVAGLDYVRRGARLLRRPGLRRYILIPLLTNLLLLGVAAVVLYQTLEQALADWLPAALDWLRYVLLPLAGLVFALVFFFVFTFIANLLATPFNGALSSAVLRELQGAALGPESSLMQELRLGLAGELAKAAYFVKLSLPCALLSLLPGVNVLSVIVWPVFGAWALAIEYLDCPLGNHLRPFPAALQAARQQRRLAFGFGAGVALLTAVPVLNFIAMPVGVAGATLLYHERLRPRAGNA